LKYYEQGPRTSNPINGLFAADINGDGVSDVYSVSSNPHVLPFQGTTKTVTTGVLDVGLGQTGKGDPLKTKVSTRGNATVALNAIKKLKKFIEKDLKGLEDVLDDLEKAQSFAKAGVLGADAVVRSQLTLNNASSLAEALRNAIQTESRGTAGNINSALDTKLVMELLKDPNKK
jgi:hypothetical protein